MSTAVELSSTSGTFYIVAGILTIIVIIGVIIYDKVFPDSIGELLPIILVITVVAVPFTIMGSLFPLSSAYRSNVESIESHYSVIITSKDDWRGIYPVTGRKGNEIEKYEITFNNGSPEEEFDEINGEIRIKKDKAVLFYVPDSLDDDDDDEMIPYEAE